MAAQGSSGVGEERWNVLLRRGVARAQLLTPEVQQAMRKVLAHAGVEAAERLERFQVAHPVGGVSAAGNAPWTRPEADVLVDLHRLADALMRANSRLRERMVKAALGELESELGVNFDLRNPVIDGVLNQAGQNIQAVAETQRATIMRSLSDSWDAGMSIQQAAAAIVTKTDAISATRATVIARTEIIGIANGGSLAAAKITGSMARKEWLTAGGAKHPRHHDYPDLDGQLRPLDAMFSVGGAALRYPGDPGGPANEVCNCRCTLAYRR